MSSYCLQTTAMKQILTGAFLSCRARVYKTAQQIVATVPSHTLAGPDVTIALLEIKCILGRHEDFKETKLPT